MYVEKMPKFERYAIGLPILEKSFSILDLVLLARIKHGPSQVLLVRKIDVELKSMQLRLRIGNAAKAVPHKHYIRNSEQLAELGKIIGGWIKNAERRE
jgi:hypothetical protein